MSPSEIPRIVITSGEPAGIGPDICIGLAPHTLDTRLVVLGDIDVLSSRARQLKAPLQINLLATLDDAIPQHFPGFLNVYPIKAEQAVIPGELDAANAKYVVKMLDIATQACLTGKVDAMVTGPVHKGIINDAGISFTGHTEYLAKLTGTPLPVMMLETEGLRVALVTTHLPLRDVASSITKQRLADTITILHQDLATKYAIAHPKIYICGINPHAGESGHLGDEELKIIQPVLSHLRKQGMDLIGPLAADTIFSPENLQQADAFLAMYHDQGLPVLKYRGFGRAINVTLGLPIIRTSVDHGTALSLAGTGQADEHSLMLAIEAARRLAAHKG